MKTAIVTDSTAYLSKEDVKKYDIHVIAIPVIFDSEVFREGIDITSPEFYNKLAQSNKLPTTSQPALGVILDEYNKLAEDGYDAVISIHLSATISGMVKQIGNVAGMLDNIKVYPFDSQLTVYPMAEMAIYASKLAKQGVEPEEIIKKLKEFRNTVDELFVVDDLKNLAKGGRLSNAASFVGSMLNIKPLLTFDDTHEIVAFDKVRTKKKALRKVEKLFAKALANIKYPVKCAVLDSNVPEEGDKWFESLKKQFPNVDFVRGEIGPVIGTHLGSGALAIAWYKNIDNIK